MVHAVIEREVRALWSGGKGKALLAVALAWGLVVGARMIYPVVIPYVQEAHGLSYTLAGLLMTILWFFYSMGMLPGGVLADRYEERLIFVASVLGTAGAIGLVVVAPGPAILFLATAVWGLSSSLFSVPRITFLSSTYPDRLGTSLGITMATGDVGQTILPVGAAIVAALLAWQAGLLFTVPLFVAAAVLIVASVPATTQTAGSSETTTSSEASAGWGVVAVLQEVRTPRETIVVVILFLYYLVWQSFTAFYPIYLTTVKGMSAATASLLFALFFASGAVMKPLSGVLYDRAGLRVSLVAILAPPILGFLAITNSRHLLSLVVSTVAISCMLGTGTITQSSLATAFSDQTQGTGLGTIKLLTSAVASAGPLVFGIIADHGSLDGGYLVLAILIGLCVGLVTRIPTAK